MVIRGEREKIPCPVDGVGTLEVEWIPLGGELGGEFRLFCPDCGAENFVLKQRSSETEAGGHTG